MFGLVGRGELTPSTESEFEGLFSKLKKFLLAQHNEDGSHSDITVRSISAPASASSGATGNISAGGDVTVDGDVDIQGSLTAAQEQTGTIVKYAKLIRDYTGLSALRIRNAASPLIADWTITTDYAPIAGYSNALSFVDNATVANQTEVTRLEPDGAGTPGINYRLIPSGSVQLKIGDNDSGAANVVSEVHASLVNALSGYTERFRTVPSGTWTTPTFATGNFTSVGGGTSWTVAAGNVTTRAFTRYGKTMTVSFEIVTTDVTGAPTELNILIPDGATAAKQMRNLIIVNNAGGGFTTGFAQVLAGGTVIRLFSSPGGGGWADTGGGANTYVLGQITFETTT